MDHLSDAISYLETDALKHIVHLKMIDAYAGQSALNYERLGRLVRESALPALTVDISDNSVPCAVEKIADWLEQTGGLYV